MRSSNDSIVVAELRRRLFTGDLRPGLPVNIADVADDLGISTAPVRDALMRLSERGLINRVEGRGFFVAVTPDHEASELLGILHNIITLAIEKSRLPNGLDRDEVSPDNPPSLILTGHDQLNEMLERICSPTVAAIAVSVADRLWDVRRRIADHAGRACPEARLVAAIMRLLARSDRPRAKRLVDIAYKSSQKFLLKQMVNG
ncbi:GntR family transcriptional regulator [Agrobacterium sp. SORGH_AS 787]|uniref:GntR family transcriptional regulator n=1 Tax=Agrobacterium sp. SORGH_AS 787 TaxID=3041775 RepID=UPI002780B27F|nr:DNA-binding GntR family transcriptional regulator [Rhizobium sp. SORGH_AS_0787]